MWSRNGVRRAWALGASAVLMAAADPRAAAAQCAAKRTECSACHDGQRAALDTKSAWHRDHGFTDLCVDCHGGKPDAADAALAHVGMVAPLDQPESQCASCHPNAVSLVSTYRAPGAPGGPSPPPEPPRGPTASPHGEPAHNLAAGLVAGAIAMIWGAYAYRNELRRSKERPRQTMHLRERAAQ